MYSRAACGGILRDYNKQTNLCSWKLCVVHQVVTARVRDRRWIGLGHVCVRSLKLDQRDCCVRPQSLARTAVTAYNVRGGAIRHGVVIPHACMSLEPQTPPLSITHNHHHMPRRPNKKAQRYGDHEERVAKAIKDLKDNPESKMKHVAAHY